MEQDNNEHMNNTDGHTHTDAEDTHMHDHTESVATPIAQTNENKADGISEHKLYAILGYVLPFLFFLPLLQESSKNNEFAKFHANQQLLLLITWVGVQVVLSNVLYMVIYMLAGMLMSLLSLGILVLAIMGIISASQGTMKELPLIGKFRILK